MITPIASFAATPVAAPLNSISFRKPVAQRSGLAQPPLVLTENPSVEQQPMRTRTGQHTVIAHNTHGDTVALSDEAQRRNQQDRRQPSPSYPTFSNALTSLGIMMDRAFTDVAL